ncbi:hypothetical protein GCM10023185_15240 [Hymenobacter saemangeumensis]|uniref:Carbonic anhydrase n=1 Tax=Hymenobacter saemangeumensis TaxID=1084522 RepID=A0ABP8I998_9BACT
MNRTYPTEGYQVPKKNLLLISCIDLRLMDDLVRFMDHENLTNRYDHFILAGSSLGTTLLKLEGWKNEVDDEAGGKFDVRKFKPASWEQTLHEHLGIAKALHKIEDVYIVEHENCGAYRAFVTKEVLADKGEEGCQRISSTMLAKEIEQKYGLQVHCFLMDLRGNVKLLERQAA